MQIDRRDNLSYAEFAEQYLYPKRPVILTDACKGWGAMGKWTPDYFLATFPDKVVEIDDKPWTMPDYIARLHASTADDTAPYMRNINIAEVFPEALDDVMPLPPHFGPNWLHDKYFPGRLDAIMRINSAVEVYIGGPGATFPIIHFDSIYTHAYLTQLYGKKELYLWAPDQAPYMYATGRNNVSTVNDAINPDLERFPLFAKAQGASVVIEPGETLFVPSGWWHTARMLTESITVSVNVANKSNWREVSRDIAQNQKPVLRAAFQAYMNALGAFKPTTPPAS